MKQLEFDFVREEKMKKKGMVSEDFVWNFITDHYAKLDKSMRQAIEERNIDNLSKDFVLLGMSITIAGLLLNAPDLIADEEILTESAKRAYSELIGFSRKVAARYLESEVKKSSQ